MKIPLFPDFLFDSFSFPCPSPRASDGPASCRVERRTAKLLRKGKCDTWPAESEGIIFRVFSLFETMYDFFKQKETNNKLSVLSLISFFSLRFS